MRLGVLLRSDDVASSRFVIRHKRPSLRVCNDGISCSSRRQESSKASSRAVRILDILCRVKVPPHQLSRFLLPHLLLPLLTRQRCYARAGSMWRVLSRCFPTSDLRGVNQTPWSISSLLFFFFLSLSSVNVTSFSIIIVTFCIYSDWQPLS